MALARRELPVKRPSRETLQDRVYASLREAIITGKFAPGQTLSNRGLAEAMGTSPIPVREAVRRLVSERGLVVLHNGSVAVPVYTAEQFRDLRWVRCVVEGEATERGAADIRGAKLARLEQCCAVMREAFEKGDRERYLRNNKKFRFTIYEACKSPILLSIIQSLWLQFGPFLNFAFAREAVDPGIAHHTNAVAAIKRGDPTGAGQAIIDDILQTGDFILASDHFKNAGSSAAPARTRPGGRQFGTGSRA